MMMIRLSLVLLLTMLSALFLPVRGEAGGEDLPASPTWIPLWEKGAPGAKGEAQGDTPGVRFYPAPAERATGAAVIVCPGGGYRNLAAHEGPDVALWLNQLGISALVLQYRLGPTYQHPAMLQDVQRAVRLTRARAGEWKIDPRRIGIMGFSAGGHLASTAATWFDEGTEGAADLVERMSSRPDLAILCYPVITMHAPSGHAGSRRNLLGENPTPELVDRLSSERQVTSRTPPTFLFHTADDASVPVENSLLFAAALRRANVPYELHVYQSGRHGVGLAKDHPTLGSWPGLLASWLRSHGFTR
ncbi:MAG: alpha/beta hydrolase [Blastocatellia bacterium]